MILTNWQLEQIFRLNQPITSKNRWLAGAFMAAMVVVGVAVFFGYVVPMVMQLMAV